MEFAAKPLEYPTPKGAMESADLPAALALALGTNEPPTAAALSERMLDDPSLLSTILGRLSRPLPVTPVLVIDQAEEMFTLARSPDEEWGRSRVLEMIRQVGDRRGDFKLIVSLRTEYYGRLVSALRRGLSDVDGVREYLLADLDLPAMVKVIRRPTLRERLPHTGEIPFEKYRGFDYAQGVPETIAHQIGRHGRTDGVALLLQVICAQLFERALGRDDHRVSEEDLRAIGGFEGALSRHVKRQIERLLPGNSAQVGFNAQVENLHRIVAERRPAAEFIQAARATLATLRDPRTDPERFQVLLTHLTLRQVDGTLTTGLIHENDLRNLWDGQAAFDTLLPRACDLRLFRTTTRPLDEGSDERLVSLGHDALAKVALPWKLDLERRAERRKWRIRGVIATAAAAIFAGLALLAMQESQRALKAEKDALVNEARATDSKNEAVRERGEAEQQRKLAETARKEAVTNEARAKIMAAKALDSAEESRQHMVRLYLGNGARLLDEGNTLGSLLYFSEALALDHADAGAKRCTAGGSARSCDIRS